jgi:hypothetical protein
MIHAKEQLSTNYAPGKGLAAYGQAACRMFPQSGCMKLLCFCEGSWRRWVHEPLTEPELAALPQSVTSGRPYGSEGWVKGMASALGLRLDGWPRGRPRKHPSASTADKCADTGFFPALLAAVHLATPLQDLAEPLCRPTSPLRLLYGLRSTDYWLHRRFESHRATGPPPRTNSAKTPECAGRTQSLAS